MTPRGGPLIPFNDPKRLLKTPRRFFKTFRHSKAAKKTKNNYEDDCRLQKRIVGFFGHLNAPKQLK